MKKHSRMLFTLLSLIMVLSLAACQTAAPSSTTALTTAPADDTVAPTEQATDAPPVADPNAIFAKYDPPVVLHAARKTRAPIKFIEGEDYVTNAFSIMLKEKMGIEIQYDWMVDESQYESKVNLTIASGAIPDVFSVTATQEQTLIENNLIVDLTDLVEQHASPLLKKIIKGDPKLYKTVLSGGKLYDIPMMPSIDFNTNVLYVRKDWLDKVGLPEPKTLAEFTAVLDAFVNQDPDGNGKKDTIGLSLNKDFNLPACGKGDIGPMFEMFGAHYGAWIKDADDKLVFGDIQPEMKLALQNMQDMFKAGLIDPEFSVKDQAKVAEDIVAERSGVEFGVFWTPAYPWQDVYTKNKKLVLSCLDIPSADGKGVPTVATLTPLVKTVVSTTCKNPEAVVKMVSFTEEIFWATGDLNKEWQTRTTDAKYEPIAYSAGMNNYPLVMMEPPTLNYDLVDEVTKGVDAGDANVGTTAEGIKEIQMILDYQAGKNDLNWSMWSLRYGKNSGTGISNQRQDAGLILISEFYGVPGPVQTERSATLKKMEQEMITKIIMNEAPVSDFDAFVTSWKAAGGDDLTAEINAWYEKNK